MNTIAADDKLRRLSQNNEFKYFLYISKGSCGEVRSMLVLAYELHKISQTDLEDMSSLSEEISKMLSGFIKTL